MHNVSVWETLDDAKQMDTLQAMLDLRPPFVAAGVRFERPITNHETLWADAGCPVEGSFSGTVDRRMRRASSEEARVEETRKQTVDGVPLCWHCPQNPQGIAIHVPAFGQTKEQAAGVLDFLCGAGFASIVIDAFQHGERGREDRAQIDQRVFSSFRRSMWTIIGMTALDLPSIAEWARETIGARLPVHLTGLSMGGDTVVAAAPLIEGVASVNAVIATPDWTRPGMRDISSGELIHQGPPDSRAQLLYDALNPITHHDRYRDLPIRFIVGEMDTHVPAEAALRFASLVNEDGGRVSVVTKPGLSHLDFVKRDWWYDFDFASVS